MWRPNCIRKVGGRSLRYYSGWKVQPGRREIHTMSPNGTAGACIHVEEPTQILLVDVDRNVPSRGHNSPAPERNWQPWLEREARLERLNMQLETTAEIAKDQEVALRYERATMLAQSGRNLEARSDYLKVLALDPTHKKNLIDLGRVLVATKRLKAAQMVYEEAVKQYPEDIVCRVNLGSVLLEREDPAGAHSQYEAALRIDPD